jgi:uncharacterized membrane protein required for colicin V production
MFLDLVFGFLLLLGAARGFRQGFANQALHLAGIAFGLILAEPVTAQLWPYAGPRMTLIPEAARAPLLFFAVMAAIVLAILAAGASYLKWRRKTTFGENKPSLADRVFGVLPGVLKYAFLICLFAFAMGRLPGVAREISAVRSQLDSSVAVRLANRYRIVEKLLETEEFVRLRDNAGQLVRYYRSREEAPAPESDDAAPAEAAPPSAGGDVQQLR